MTRTDALPALVTGASRGLGFAIARALAAKGHHVMAVARTIGGLEELDDAIKQEGGAATLAPMDITNDAAMQQLCRSIHDRWGGLALWIHTAIRADSLGPAAYLSQKDFDASLAVNVQATRRLIGYVLPLLGAAGTAVFFDDPRGGEQFFGPYGTSTAAQIALARSFAAESARIGPAVRILEPRPMPTAVRGRFFPGEDRARLASPASEAARLLPEILA